LIISKNTFFSYVHAERLKIIWLIY